KVLRAIDQKEKVEIKWYYSDEDMMEAGEDYSDLTKLEFSFYEYRTSNKLNLIFDTDQFDELEIAEVIAEISNLYYHIGGDRLLIRGTEMLENDRVPTIDLT
ncbi:MAG: SiaC family regulatory phosphoprotein, partial [Bacteroidota bacterium]